MATFSFLHADGSITKSQSTAPTGTVRPAMPSLHFSLLSVRISQSQWHHEHSDSGRSSCEVSTDLSRRQASVGDWASLLRASCLWEYVLWPMSGPCAWYCKATCSLGLTILSVCLHVITPFWHLPPTLVPSLLSSLFFSPSPRFSLAPHPSRCQALVHSASPLAPWPGLPSNNFISFPPLSRRPAPPLTIGCCFLPEKKKAEGYVGQVENPTIADSVLDTGQWYWWLQWGCMDQRSHTKGLPVSAHAELESKWHRDYI